MPSRPRSVEMEPAVPGRANAAGPSAAHAPDIFTHAQPAGIDGHSKDFTPLQRADAASLPQKATPNPLAAQPAPIQQHEGGGTTDPTPVPSISPANTPDTDDADVTPPSVSPSEHAASGTTSDTQPLPPADQASDAPPQGGSSQHAMPVLPAHASRRESKRDLPLECQIVGCGVSLATQAEYYQRYRICRDHLRSLALVVDDVPQRFCQQCGRFHLLEAFDGQKRNCRARLAQHNSRRRKTATAGEGGADAPRRYGAAAAGRQSAFHPNDLSSMQQAWELAEAASQQQAGRRRGREEYEGAAYLSGLPPHERPAAPGRFPAEAAPHWYQPVPADALMRELSALLPPGTLQALVQNVQPLPVSTASHVSDARRMQVLQLLSRSSLGMPEAGQGQGGVYPDAGRSAFLRPQPIRPQAHTYQVPPVPCAGFVTDASTTSGLMEVLAALAPTARNSPDAQAASLATVFQQQQQQQQQQRAEAATNSALLMQLMAQVASTDGANSLQELQQRLQPLPPQPTGQNPSQNQSAAMYIQLAQAAMAQAAAAQSQAQAPAAQAEQAAYAASVQHLLTTLGVGGAGDLPANTGAALQQLAAALAQPEGAKAYPLPPAEGSPPLP